MHYQAARSFAPLILSAEPVESGFAIHAISDLHDPVTGELVVELIDFDGMVRWRSTKQVKVAANTAAIVAQVPLAAGDVLVSRIVGSAGDLARDVRMVRDATAGRLPGPGLSARIEHGVVIVRAENFARAVKIAVDAGNLSDNYFDLLPGEERRLTPREGRLADDAPVAVASLADWIA